MQCSSGRGSMMLALSDGSVFRGNRLGAEREAAGLVVFNTSMTGYEEMLTDPSYGGQILVPTYPLIGNYGVNLRDAESSSIQVKAFVVRGDCDAPSHPYSEMTVHDYLLSNGVPGVSGVDTRAITRRLRSAGVMMGVVMPGEDASAAFDALKRSEWYGDHDWVAEVSAKDQYDWNGDAGDTERSSTEQAIRAARNSEASTVDGMNGSGLRIAVVDFGVKRNILRSLRTRGCLVRVFPNDVDAETVMAFRPDGVVLSPGPGDPAMLDGSVEMISRLADIEGDGSGSIPMLGICLGHQLVARAFGADTFMLHFGHRGGNQPVLDVRSGRVYVTAQNHGYAVDPEALKHSDSVHVTHVSLNDGTVEGLADESRALMTIQFHSEASPGPHDSELIFDQFISSVRRRMSIVD